MEMNSNVITYNGEVFTRTDYNGISVLVDQDGYYNGSKICKDNGVRFNNVSRANYWIEYTEALRGVRDLAQAPLVKDRTTLPNEIRGYYVHPKLVNWLCMHLDCIYAIKVSEIMDLVNEQIHLKCSSLEEEIHSVREKNKKLKEDNDRLNKLAVPDGTNNRLLRVLQIGDNRYKVSADSYRKKFAYPIVKTFILASALAGEASMHIRKELSEDGIIDRLKFNDLEGFCSYIRNNYIVLAEC